MSNDLDAPASERPIVARPTITVTSPEPASRPPAHDRQFFPDASLGCLTAHKGGLYGSLLLDALTSEVDRPLGDGEEDAALFQRLAQQTSSGSITTTRAASLGQAYHDAKELMRQVDVDPLTMTSFMEPIARLVAGGHHSSPVLMAVIELEMLRRNRRGETVSIEALLDIDSPRDRHTVLRRVDSEGIGVRTGAQLRESQKARQIRRQAARRALAASPWPPLPPRAEGSDPTQAQPD